MSYSSPYDQPPGKPISNAPTVNTRAKWMKRVERYLGLFAEAGELPMSLRDRPGPLDWLGLGVRAVDLAVRVHSEHRELTAKDPDDFFDYDMAPDSFEQISSEFHKLMREHIKEVEINPAYWSGGDEDMRLAKGRLGSEEIFWTQRYNNPFGFARGPYVLAERAEPFYLELGKCGWAGLGSKHCQYNVNGFIQDSFEDEGYTPTTQFHEVQERLKAFVRTV